jgi:hypothetical protein
MHFNVSDSTTVHVCQFNFTNLELRVPVIVLTVCVTSTNMDQGALHAVRFIWRDVLHMLHVINAGHKLQFLIFQCHSRLEVMDARIIVMCCLPITHEWWTTYQPNRKRPNFVEYWSSESLKKWGYKELKFDTYNVDYDDDYDNNNNNSNNNNNNTWLLKEACIRMEPNLYVSFDHSNEFWRSRRHHVSINCLTVRAVRFPPWCDWRFCCSEMSVGLWR